MSIAEQKAEFRRTLLEKRRKLTATQVETASRQIVSQCIEIIPWKEIKSLHTYVPMTDRNEVRTWELLKHARNEWPGIKTAAPRMLSGTEFESIAVDADTEWKRNNFGILEPLSGELLSHDYNFGVIIVPVLGFDARGHRLGYGRGMYDQFLRSQSGALTIGLAYSEAEIKPAIPTEPHDVPLRRIITETGITLCEV